MKWENKGFELEKFRKYFRDKNLLIYGAGNVGENVLGEMFTVKSNVVGWIDRKGGQLYDLPVYRFEELTIGQLKKSIIVVAAEEPLASLFSIQLSRLGLTENIDFFRYLEWLERYQLIYDFFHNGNVTALFCGLQVANKCNLNCKGCLSFTHYLKKQSFFGLDYVKKNSDLLFSKIDAIKMFEICGGEPLLDQDVSKIYEYIGNKYRDKVQILSTVTNGTIIPREEVCEILKEYKYKVYLDDYRDNVEITKKTFDMVYEKLCSSGVDVEIRKVDSWIDIGVNDNEKKDDNTAFMRHTECSNSRLSFMDEKLFYCDYECFASKAGVIIADINDYLDFKNLSISREALLEFILGYSEKGYCSMCCYCNGDGKINRFHIPVAEQYTM